MHKTIFISAIEYSANIHVAKLIESLESMGLEFTLYGIFDSKIIHKQNTFSPDDFRIMGFSSALKLIPKYFKLKQELIQIASKCDISIFIDSSSFNIPIIKTLKKTSTTHIIYYILPQVWAWKRYRAKILNEICDELWGILPFEKDFYPNANKVSYVGHPLLDEIPYSYKNRLHTNKIALMPGSRNSEIKYLFPIFKEITKKIPNKKFILIVPKRLANNNLHDIYGDIENFEISYEPYDGLRDCEFAFVCSGTATLETTLLGIPTILAYKTRIFDFVVAKMLVNLKYIGLSNIFLNYKNSNNIEAKDINIAPIIPEFLQFFNAESIIDSYQTFDYNNFFRQKEELLNYLKHGSANVCAEKLENFYKISSVSKVY